MRPDLAWIQDQVAADGLRFDRIRGDGFQCQCPVHRGDGMSAVFSVRNGMLLFYCHAHGCSFRDMKDALDLTEGDCYADYILRDRRREIERRCNHNLSDDRLLLEAARADRKAGKRLEGKALENYRAALVRQHRGLA